MAPPRFYPAPLVTRRCCISGLLEPRRSFVIGGQEWGEHQEISLRGIRGGSKSSGEGLLVPNRGSNSYGWNEDDIQMERVTEGIFECAEKVTKSAKDGPKTTICARKFVRVSEDHGKSFCFPKQHFIVHALQDIRSKGVLRNATTRTVEGFHQETAQHYRKTNLREAEGQQIANEDEDQKAIARTRLIVDDFFRHLHSESGDENEATEDTAQFKQKSGRRIPRSKLPPASRDNQWIFGSVRRCGDSRSYEDLHANYNVAYRSFDTWLRDFLHGQFPTEYLTTEDKIESNDDWSESEDILRCNHNWYISGPRYNGVLFNQDDPGLACARLRSLIRCKSPSGRIVDLANIRS
ncbi:hypothetical protein B0H19DRAFT_1083755 [Mycena capillaripes]|nr:hypothetical protein B0H19DRAFT_1083755 [Mycena capillaripes]